MLSSCYFFHLSNAVFVLRFSIYLMMSSGCVYPPYLIFCVHASLSTVSLVVLPSDQEIEIIRSIRVAAMLFSLYLCIIFIYFLHSPKKRLSRIFRLSLPVSRHHFDVPSSVMQISLASDGADVMLWSLFAVKLKLRLWVTSGDVAFILLHDTRWSCVTCRRRWRHIPLLAFLKSARLYDKTSSEWFYLIGQFWKGN
jgi:hypothetical protein